MTQLAEMPSIEDLQVAKVYADALWELAVERGVEAELLEEYRSLIEDVLDAEPELEVFFGLSSLGSASRIEMIENIFAGRASQLLLDFLQTLERHNRLGSLRAILYRLNRLADEQEGKVDVLVRSATPLPEDQRVAIEAMIADRFGIQPKLEVETTPDLLGGLWVQIGDTVYDDSVRWHLKRLRDSIRKKSSHEIRSE